MRLSLLFALLALPLAATTCDPDPVPTADAPPAQAATDPIAGEVIEERIDSELGAFRLVRVAGDLSNPWGMAFLPDGRMLVTERAGRLHVFENGQRTQVTGLPEIAAQGQGGLLDIVPHPDYEQNGWIYFSYAARGDGGAGTAIARARLDGATLTDLETLHEMEQKTGRGQHFGSRILFLGDGTLLFTIGDRGEMELAQDLMHPAGSILRINEDGGIPEDNPFVGRDDVLPELYTVGNRNIQGFDRHPETGAVWQTEHGPRGGDELNLVRAGANYGWPEATFGRDYRTQEQIGVTPDQAPQFVEPVTYWTPTIAPSGTHFYRGGAFPAWQNHLFIGSLVQQKLIRVELDGEAVVAQEDLLAERIGRIRHVTEGPDGFLYLLTDESDGAVYRLEPADG